MSTWVYTQRRPEFNLCHRAGSSLRCSKLLEDTTYYTKYQSQSEKWLYIKLYSIGMEASSLFKFVFCYHIISSNTIICHFKVFSTFRFVYFSSKMAPLWRTYCLNSSSKSCVQYFTPLTNTTFAILKTISCFCKKIDDVRPCLL